MECPNCKQPLAIALVEAPKAVVKSRIATRAEIRAESGLPTLTPPKEG